MSAMHMSAGGYGRRRTGFPWARCPLRRTKRRPGGQGRARRGGRSGRRSGRFGGPRGPFPGFPGVPGFDFGWLGTGPGGHFRGGRGRGRRGDVRAALLVLLAEEPRNGYQLIQEISERSGGVWQPSPGSVYPALSQLEDEGLVVAGEVGVVGARSGSPTPDGATSREPRTGSELRGMTSPRRLRT